MAKVILHDYWRSSASYRVRIALALKGIAYDRVPVDLTKGAQRSEQHLRVNPQGLVPALTIDGVTLTQSLAIIEYLDETRPVPSLLPADPVLRAHARTLALAIACEVHPISNLRTLAAVEHLAGKDARTAWNCDNIRTGLEAFERLLDHPGFSGAFCVGETPGIADCTLIPQLYNATRWGVDWHDLPRIVAVAEGCANLAAFKAAEPEQFA